MEKRNRLSPPFDIRVDMGVSNPEPEVGGFGVGAPADGKGHSFFDSE